MVASWMAYWLWAIQKFNNHFADLGQVKKISAFSLYKTPLEETGCLGNPYFFTYWLPKHPASWFLPFSQHNQSGRLWLPTPYCAAPVWVMERYATPLVTRCFIHQPLTSSLTLPCAIARFLDPFYTFSPAHCRVIRDFAPTPTLA